MASKKKTRADQIREFLEKQKEMTLSHTLESDLTLEDQNVDHPFQIYRITDDRYVLSVLNKQSSIPTIAKRRYDNVIIVDASGSMNAVIGYIYKDLLPAILKRYGVTDDTDTFSIIAFGNYSRIETNLTLSTLATVKVQLKLQDGGGTYMANAIHDLHTYLRKKPVLPVRIIAISDGQLNDHPQTMQKVECLRKEIQTFSSSVETVGIRLFTSNTADPSTAGLASILNLSTHLSGELKLLDLPYMTIRNIEVDMDKIKELFSVKLDTCQVEANAPLFLTTPWGTTATQQTTLSSAKSGENFIGWLCGLPSYIVIDKKRYRIDPTQAETLTHINESMINAIFTMHYQRIKINKVVNLKSNQDEIVEILNFCERMEQFINRASDAMAASLQPKAKEDGFWNTISGLGGNQSLYARLERMKKSVNEERESIFDLIRKSAHSERIDKLNSEQQAAFLRTVTTDGLSARNARNLKGLVSRGESTLGSLDQIVRDEFEAIALHISELAEVNDQDHARSYYTKNTTLESLRIIAHLFSQDPQTFQRLNTIQLLSLLNIVGIAAYGHEGDFPDPMIYRYTTIHPYFTSIADIICQRMVPGYEHKRIYPGPLDPNIPNNNINNVVPWFDDDRVHKFVLKYAQNTLDVLASIGMRRLQIIVPATHFYSVTNGISAVVQAVYDSIKNKNNSYSLDDPYIQETNAHVSLRVLFKKLLDSNLTNAHGYFTHTLGTWNNPFDNPDNFNADGKLLSFYIFNCGTTNSIYAANYILSKNESEKFNYRNRAAYLRALYAYEISQNVKKIFRDSKTQQEDIKSYIEKFLCINKHTHALHPLPQFVPEPLNPTHSTMYSIEPTEYSNIMTPLESWLPSILILPELMLQAYNLPIDQPINFLMDAWRAHALGLDDCSEHGYRKFVAACIVEGFHAYNKESRIEYTINEAKERVYKDRMKTIDLGYKNQGADFLKEVAQGYYVDEYKSRLAQKKLDEKFVLAKDYLKLLMDASRFSKTNDEKKSVFCQLLVNGLTRGQSSITLSSQEVTVVEPLRTFFRQKLSNHDADYAHAIFLFVTARYDTPITVPITERPPLWNHGNIDMFMKNMATHLKSRFPEYAPEIDTLMKTSKYEYHRSMLNRHKHGPEKPSFYALGYSTFENMVSCISPDELKAYLAIHSDCCSPNAVVRRRLGKS
jgi:hypothetical protein